MLMAPEPQVAALDLLLDSLPMDGGLRRSEVSVPGIHCDVCKESIERALGSLDGVQSCGVDLARRRVSVAWHAGTVAPPLIAALLKAGYDACLIEPAAEQPVSATRQLSRPRPDRTSFRSIWRSLWSARAWGV